MRPSRYRTIVDELAQAIRAGDLKAGTQLPTHRALSKERGIALVTANKVYQALDEMGLVSSEVGRGTFVRNLHRPPGYGPIKSNTPPHIIDLAFNYPTTQHKHDLIQTSLRRLSERDDVVTLLMAQPTQGRQAERELIVSFLASYELPTTPEHILLLAGVQQGLAIAIMTLCQPGDIIAVDELSYPGFISFAKHYQIELLPIPSDGQGTDLNALAAALQERPIKAIYAMPTLHNPMGWVMSMAKRQELVALAREHRVWIIEDASYAFLVPSPPPTLTSMAPERCLYIGGVSKFMGGGVRFAYMVAPTELIDALSLSLQAMAWSNPPLISMMVGEWFRDGTIHKNIQFRQKEAQAKHQLAIKVLDGLSMQSNPNSFFIWIKLPEGVRVDILIESLAQQHIRVASADVFCAGQTQPHAIRLSLGGESIDRLRLALSQVRKTIELLSLEQGAVLHPRRT